MTTLKPFGYYLTTECPNIWAHTTRKTTFCLCDDDFGVKYFNQDNADQLLTALKLAYKITVNATGKKKRCIIHPQERKYHITYQKYEVSPLI